MSLTPWAVAPLLVSVVVGGCCTPRSSTRVILNTGVVPSSAVLEWEYTLFPVASYDLFNKKKYNVLISKMDALCTLTEEQVLVKYLLKCILGLNIF